MANTLTKLCRLRPLSVNICSSFGPWFEVKLSRKNRFDSWFVILGLCSYIFTTFDVLIIEASTKARCTTVRSARPLQRRGQTSDRSLCLQYWSQTHIRPNQISHSSVDRQNTELTLNFAKQNVEYFKSPVKPVRWHPAGPTVGAEILSMIQQ